MGIHLGLSKFVEGLDSGEMGFARGGPLKLLDLCRKAGKDQNDPFVVDDGCSEAAVEHLDEGVDID